jgi:chemotaxis protein MotB
MGRYSYDVDVPPPKKDKPRSKTQRQKPAEHSNAERWMVSYADFVTLLFAVFATMYALSVVDAQKFSAMAASLQEAFRDGRAVLPGAGGTIVIAELPGAGAEKNPAEGPAEVGLGEVRSQLQVRLAPALDASIVTIEEDPRGLVISIREAGSFGVGAADLSEAARLILGEIGLALSKVGNHVRIEGHTDNVPIHTERFASNWELSTARATTVVRYLLDSANLPPRRLSAAGYAEYYPRVANASADARSRNRRVDIVVMSPQVRASEEPKSSLQ